MAGSLNRPSLSEGKLRFDTPPFHFFSAERPLSWNGRLLPGSVEDII